MKHAEIDNTLFARNRRNLAERLKPGSVAVFHSNDLMPAGADRVFPFVQNADLFYLSGMDQEETILLLCPDAREEQYREVLFIRKTSEEISVWQGEKYSQEQASEISGIRTVCWTSDFERIFRQMVIESRYIYLNLNEHSRADVTVETRDARFLKQCMSAFPLHRYERLAPIMRELRAVKSDIEVQMIRQACRISEKAFRRVLGFTRPGVWEYEVEAEILHEFLVNRADGPAFPSIVASGENSCVLHYEKNDRQCRDGDLLLMDFGAEYSHYASDVTRTIPVNGRFTQRQQEVYQAVRRVQKEAVNMLRPGNTLETYNKAVGRLMEEELIGLGLIDRDAVGDQPEGNPLYRKYFMHGASHHLGLDTHDHVDRYRPFEAGMVLTCEPGIYIREEGIGVRLENDILVTENNPVDLTATIPIEIEEIEALMNTASPAD